MAPRTQWYQSDVCYLLAGPEDVVEAIPDLPSPKYQKATVMNEPINTSLTAPLLNASEIPEPEVIPSIFAQTVAAISELSPSKSQRLNRFFWAT